MALAVASVANAQTGAGMAAGTASAASAPAAGPRVQCVAKEQSGDSLADKMAKDIDAKLTGRVSSVGLYENDSKTGITCQYHATWHFYAASAIKVTILAALLRKAQEAHRQLTATEKSLAWEMITESDNAAATSLWNEVGISGMQHLLNLVRMKQTKLSYAWGLTLLTAHDEWLLLHTLSVQNKVLDKASRVYARYLMAHVVSYQRWGVSAGAPRGVTVHIKNGWLNYPSDTNWIINSLGIFTATHRVYTIVVLTHDNPSEGYGIDTIEDAAEAINHDLNPGTATTATPPVAHLGMPDEVIR